jgi:hypothetical protein
LSKFGPTEFITYRRRFIGKSYIQDDWSAAWLHHIHHNPHHWEHWLLKGKPLPMPDTYVREMVIDWLAAGRSYIGSWDIQNWIDENCYKWVMHPITIARLAAILSEVGLHLPPHVTSSK